MDEGGGKGVFVLYREAVQKVVQSVGSGGRAPKSTPGDKLLPYLSLTGDAC